MNEISLAAFLWVATHFGLSSTPLRDVLVRAIGTNAYLGVYSLIAAASLGYLIWVYSDVPRFDYYWLPNPDLYWVAKLLMPVATILAVGGFMVKNPTMVGATLEDEGAAGAMAQGVTRITRHPFQWAVVIWAASHIVANGDVVSIIFFASFVVLSGVGTVLMDIKKAASFGPAWTAYAKSTSNVPFAAIIRGDNKLALSELWLPALVGLLVYALLYYFHELISGGAVVI